MRFAVVSWSGGVALHLSPRGQRTQWLIEGLEAYGSVERVGGEIPDWLAGSDSRRRSSWYRRRVRQLALTLLVDKYEPSVRRALGRWDPQVDAAVLVGFPWSPLAVAARKLARRGIPFVVDVGDPWELTNPEPEGNRFKRARARAQEQALWKPATGAIVTTEGQAEAISRLFPHLRLLVRPNGYMGEGPAATAGGSPPPAGPGEGELRLVHYGSLYGGRVDFPAIFGRLARSGRWRRVSLVQYGPDWEEALKAMPPEVAVDHRPALPWEQVQAEAGRFDAAVVLGWSNPAKMPSKAVQYLTLPIPRVALATPGSDDALAAYVRDKPGWCVLTAASGDPAGALADHLARPWQAEDLQPPPHEAWAQVAGSLASFVVATTGARGAEVPVER